MRGWMKALLLAVLVCAAAGACTGGAEIAAPDGAGPRLDEGVAPTDSSGRWGGFIGSGG